MKVSYKKKRGEEKGSPFQRASLKYREKKNVPHGQRESKHQKEKNRSCPTLSTLKEKSWVTGPGAMTEEEKWKHKTVPGDFDKTRRGKGPGKRVYSSAKSHLL